MIAIFNAALAGLLFAGGLVLSGMTIPGRVMAFLDVAGDWDPTLAFVMGGALLVYAPLFRVIVKKKYPLAAASFELPSAVRIDGRLVAGAVLFGVGWGLGGMCPGPGIVALGSMSTHALVFVASMTIGAFGYRLVNDALTRSRAAAAEQASLSHAPDA